MATQTGSIDLTASNSVKLAAEAGWQSDLEDYATKAELSVQADRIGMVVANNDASSSLQLTADAMTYIGNNVTIKGTDGTTTAISGGRIQANSLSIGAFDSAAQSATLNSNISVGGRNLLPTSLVNSNIQSGVTVAGITIVLEDDGWFKVSGTRTGTSSTNISLWGDGNYTTPAVPQLNNLSGKTLTWTVETEGTPFVAGSTYDTTTHIVAYKTSSSASTRMGGFESLVKTATVNFTHYGEIRYYIGENVPAGTTVDGRFRIMVEFGNVSTAWTYAPEDAVTFVDVGGRNLLRHTGNLAESDFTLSRSTVANGVITLTPTTSAGYAKFKVDYLDFDGYGEGEYTLSFDAKAVSGATYTQLKGPMFYPGFNIPSRAGNILSSSYDRYTSFTLSPTLTNEWVHFSQTFMVPNDLTTGQASALTSGSNLTIQFAMSGSYAPMQVRNVKLERGNKATDWTAAPEDVDAAISDAAKTATSYVTDITGGGIMVHPSTDQTTGVRVTSDVDILRSGTSVINIGTGDAVRVGSASGGHIAIDSDSMDFWADADQLAMSFSGQTINDHLYLAKIEDGVTRENDDPYNLHSYISLYTLEEPIYSGATETVVGESMVTMHAYARDGDSAEISVYASKDPNASTASKGAIIAADNITCEGTTNVGDPYGNVDGIKLGDPARVTSSKSSTALANDTMGPDVVLTAGKWLIMGNWNFLNSSSNEKRLVVGLYRNATGQAYTYRVHTTASSNSAHRLEVVDTIVLTSEETITLYGASSPASTSAGTQWISAIRLA